MCGVGPVVDPQGVLQGDVGRGGPAARGGEGGVDAGDGLDDDEEVGGGGVVEGVAGAGHAAEAVAEAVGRVPASW